MDLRGYGRTRVSALVLERSGVGQDPGLPQIELSLAVSVGGDVRALQAQELRIPLVEVPIPPACSNEVYEARVEGG